jgi:hypothetical protein
LTDLSKELFDELAAVTWTALPKREREAQELIGPLVMGAEQYFALVREGLPVRPDVLTFALWCRVARTTIGEAYDLAKRQLGRSEQAQVAGPLALERN